MKKAQIVIAVLILIMLMGIYKLSLLQIECKEIENKIKHSDSILDTLLNKPKVIYLDTLERNYYKM